MDLPIMSKRFFQATSCDEDVAEEAKEAIIQLTEAVENPNDIETCPEDAEALPTRDSTPSKTLTNKTLQQEFEVLSLNLGSVKAEGLMSGKRSIKFTATVAANQVIFTTNCVVIVAGLKNCSVVIIVVFQYLLK